MVGSLPRWIYAAHKGNYLAWAVEAKELFRGRYWSSEGMTYSVICADRDASMNREAIISADAAYPRLRNVFTLEGFDATCKLWGVPGRQGGEGQPVASDVPTLILTGEYDYKTPPEFGEMTAKTLTRSFLINFAHGGHSQALSDPCPMSILTSFIDNPSVKPVAECIGQMSAPDW